MASIKPLSLRRNFSWTFIGNLVYAACQWGMVVLLAKLGSPEMVGRFTLGFAITAPIFMFTNLHLRAVQATDAKNQFAFNDYLSLRISTTALALLALTAFTLISKHSWDNSLVILLIGLAKGCESISDVLYGLIQQQERMDKIAISLMIKGPLSLLLMSAAVYLSGSIIWGVIGLVAAWSFVLLFFDLPSGVLLLEQTSLKTVKPRWHLQTLKKLISLSLPLGFVMMLISLNTNIPRYFIEQYLGVGELGIFAAIAYLMVVINMVVNALGESASPRLAKYYACGDRQGFSWLLLKLLGIAIVLAATSIIISLIFGKQILTLLYQPEYGERSYIFTWLMVAAGMGNISSFLGYGITAARYFRVQMPLFLIVTGVSAASCRLLIPSKGIEGAVSALILAAFVQVLISLAVLFHALHKLKKA